MELQYENYACKQEVENWFKRVWEIVCWVLRDFLQINTSFGSVFLSKRNKFIGDSIFLFYLRVQSMAVPIVSIESLWVVIVISVGFFSSSSGTTATTAAATSIVGERVGSSWILIVEHDGETFCDRFEAIAFFREERVFLFQVRDLTFKNRISLVDLLVRTNEHIRHRNYAIVLDALSILVFVVLERFLDCRRCSLNALTTQFWHKLWHNHILDQCFLLRLNST